MDAGSLVEWPTIWFENEAPRDWQETADEIGFILRALLYILWIMSFGRLSQSSPRS
jgi:hypothetical protein